MFTPQISDLTHNLTEVTSFAAHVERGRFGDLSMDLVDAVLSEAGRFAAEVLAPINRPGDVEGCTFDPDTSSVVTASGWRDAYRQWSEAGWPALPCEPKHGGQGLPVTVGLAVQELWNTAASAFGIGTLLTQGAVDALVSHGSDELQAKYLPSMVSGDWMGTMNLTESQAGSDLSLIKTRAEPAGDGSYRITGTKIFITHGEHDLTENIIHLVLARLPDAPPGTRGISLFLVPKVHVNDDGGLGQRNDVKCIGIEHKLGIHGSPTCTMRYGDTDGAVGWLVGEENKGLNCMFTMMNNARLHVGMQGVAVAERACQQALAFAEERKQGRGPDGPDTVAIIEHADVRRMILRMKALTAAARCICYETALALDLSQFADNATERDENAALGALLTPVAKAFSTDIGVEVASLGVQVHGGMGFIEETGAAQHLRDARITPIYEGTNGIQALDLVTRKLPLDNGQTLARYLADKSDLAQTLADTDNEDLSVIGGKLQQAIQSLLEATEFVTSYLPARDERAVALATPYLELFGLTAGGAGLARGALAAAGRAEQHRRHVTVAPGALFRRCSSAPHRSAARCGHSRCRHLGGDHSGNSATQLRIFMSTLLLSHPVCIEHEPPQGHPERPDRLRAVNKILENEAFDDLIREEAPAGRREDILRAHPEDYVHMIEQSVPDSGLERLDPDTWMGPKSLDAALRCVGAGTRGVDAVMNLEVSNVFCAVRPPGHHAESRRAMGFCLYNSVAIAAHYAQEAYGADRVAVVDFDVHHGNGTQDIFWSENDMFYGSTHQMPLYPGTGEVSETGVGNIFNAPLRAGDDGERFREAMRSRILPALDTFEPDLVIISAGFDAHRNDPLASLELTEEDFVWATLNLMDIASRHCDGRVVSMLEGGYDLQGLASFVAVHVQALMRGSGRSDVPESEDGE